MLIKCLKCLVFMQFVGDKLIPVEDGVDEFEVYVCPNCGVKIGLDFMREEEI